MTRQKCPTCGQTIKALRWEHLNAGLVNLLIKSLWTVQRLGKNRFHYTDDLGASYRATQNFQKLRYHGLVAHAEKDKLRSGYWLITSRGGQFLRGEIAVKYSVPIFNNAIVEDRRDDCRKIVTIREYRGLRPEFNPKFAYEDPIVIPKAEAAGLFPPKP